MKSLKILFLAAMLAAASARADVPSIIASGFDAYKASGSKGALAIWLRGAPPSANLNTAGLPPDVGPGSDGTDAFGPMESYEVLAAYSPSARLRRIYAVAYFPQGPLFCSFDLCRISGAWTVYGLKFSVTADQVLPVDLIEKGG
jgi:hypothetical protein